jgi:hypothetical protein
MAALKAQVAVLEDQLRQTTEELETMRSRVEAIDADRACLTSQLKVTKVCGGWPRSRSPVTDHALGQPQTRVVSQSRRF